MGLPSRKACCQPLRETIAEASIAHCAETRYPTCSVQRSDCFAFCGLQGPQDISHCSRHRYASAPPFHTTTFLLPVDEDDQHTPYYRPDLSGPAGVRPCRQTSCTTLSRHTHPGVGVSRGHAQPHPTKAQGILKPCLKRTLPES